MEEPASSGDMFGGLQMTNDNVDMFSGTTSGDNVDMFSGMSMDAEVPEEPEKVEEAYEPPAAKPKPKPVPAKKREPVTKPASPRKAYEKNLEGELEMHQDEVNSIFDAIKQIFCIDAIFV